MFNEGTSHLKPIHLSRFNKPPRKKNHCMCQVYPISLLLTTIQYNTNKQSKKQKGVVHDFNNLKFFLNYFIGVSLGWGLNPSKLQALPLLPTFCTTILEVPFNPQLPCHGEEDNNWSFMQLGIKQILMALLLCQLFS